MKPDLLIDGILQDATWISYLLLSGAVLTAVVFIHRWFGKGSFKVGQVELQLRYFPHVVVAMTIAHLYLTINFLRGLNHLNAQSHLLAWCKLTMSSAFVFHRMEPRTSRSLLGWSDGLYLARTDDIVFWMTAVFAVGLFTTVAAVSISPKATDKLPSAGAAKRRAYETRRRRIVIGVAIGITLSLANWIIGSQWAIAASKLANGQDADCRIAALATLTG